MFNERMEEIKNLDPRVFALYLERIDEEEIRNYENIKNTCGFHAHKEEIIVRDNTIHNFIASNLNKLSTFELKLGELALIFSNDNFYKQLAVGEDKFSDERIAFEFNTNVENLQMKRMLDKKLEKLNSKSNKKLVK